MQYTETYVGDVLVIHLQGRLELAVETDIFKAFDVWIREKPDFVFDCRCLEFIDSSGLGILLRLLKRAIQVERDIRLAAMNEQVQMLFEITRADQIFQIFGTCEEAVTSYGENTARRAQ